MPVQTSQAPTKPRAKTRPDTAISYGAAQLGQEVRTVIRQGTRGAARRYRLSEHESDALANEVLTQVIARPLPTCNGSGDVSAQLAGQGLPQPVGYEQWQQAKRWAERQHNGGLPEPSGYAHTHVRVAGRLVLRSRSDRMAALASLTFDQLRDSRKWLDSADGWMPRDQSKQAKRLAKFPKAPKAAVPMTVAEQAERFRAHEQEHGGVSPLTSIERLRELFSDDEGIDHVEVSAHMAAEREAGEPLPPAAMAAHRAELIPPMLAAAARDWWTPRDRQSAYVALAHGAGEPHAAIAAQLGVSTRTTKRLLKAGRALIIGQTDPRVLVAARREAVLALGMAEHRHPLPDDPDARKREIARRYLLAHAERTVSTASKTAASRAVVAGLGGPLSGKRDSASTEPLSRFSRQWNPPADPPVRDSFPFPAVSSRYGNGYGGSCSVTYLYRGGKRRAGTLG